MGRDLALAEFAHDHAALGAGEPVDVELAPQVISLMLQAAGQLAGAGDGDRPLVEIDALGDRIPAAAAVGAHAGDGQACLRAFVAAGRLDDPRVDQVAELAIGVVGERRQAGADLGGGEPGPARFPHGVDEVRDELGQRVVESGDLLARRAQDRIAQQPQRADAHDGSGTLHPVSSVNGVVSMASPSLTAVPCTRIRSRESAWISSALESYRGRGRKTSAD
jgi:hypothetical protein